MKKTMKIVKGVVLALVLLVIAFVVFILWSWFGVLRGYYNVPNDNKYVVEYDHASMQLVSDEVYNFCKDEKKLQLGVNEEGQIVFQHPYKAFGRAKKLTKEGWKFLDKECGYKHLSRTYYLAYIDAAEDVLNNGGTESQANDVKMLGDILKIYKNSWNKWR